MATKPKTNTAPLQDESVGLLDDVYNFEQLSPALSQIYSEMGVEATGQFFMQVMQVMQDGKEAQVWRGPPDDYDLAAIGKRFGSGDYRVKLYGPKESGIGVGIRANRILSIRLEAGEDARLDALRNAKPVDPALQPQLSQPALSPESLAMAIAAAIKAAMPAPVDTLGQFKQFAEAMRSMMPAPVTAAPAMDFMTVMGAAKTLLEVSKGVNPQIPVGEDGKPDFASTALLKAMDIFGETLKKAQAAAPAGGAASAALPAPTPEAGAVVVSGEGGEQLSEEDQESMLMLKLQLRAVNRAAKGGSAADEYADEVYSVIPDYIIAAMAVNPEWFALLTAAVPECKEYEQWYVALRAKLIAMAVEDGIVIRAADGALTIAPEESNVPGDGSPATPGNPAAT